MNNLFGMTLPELQEIIQNMGEPAFRAKQLSEWIYEKRITDLDQCRNISKAIRQKISADYQIGHGQIIKTQTDLEDGTKKFLIRFPDGQCVETVFMSYHHGYSLCISSQVGCSMGCRFCASTKGGKIRDLSAGEMLDQIFLAEQAENVRISNVVIMGMGEPLQNFDNFLKFIDLANNYWGISQRKITVSTCGLIPEIEKLAEYQFQINLAVSLHSPIQEQREEIMPIARKYNLKDLFKTCKKYFDTTHRRITFEYALIDGFNDRSADAEALSALFHGNHYHLNVIQLNPISEGIYKGSGNVNFFCEALKKHNINYTIRRKIGSNIDAACGQLRNKTRSLPQNSSC